MVTCVICKLVEVSILNVLVVVLFLACLVAVKGDFCCCLNKIVFRKLFGFHISFVNQIAQHLPSLGQQQLPPSFEVPLLVTKAILSYQAGIESSK